MRQTSKLLFVLVGMVGAAEPLFAAQPAPAPVVKPNLAQSIRSAQGGFHRPTAAELETARQGVLKACQALDRKLNDSPDGRSAKKSLQLDEITALAGQANLELSRLEVLDRKLGHHSHHVEGAELEALQTATRRYLQRLRANEGQETADEYVRQIDRLASAWEKYRSAKDPVSGTQIQAICQWLDQRGQAEQLCQSLRGEASHPNHRMHVSAGFLQQALTRDIAQPIVSNEMSQGAQVHVQGQIKGKLVPSLVPNPKAGAVAVHFAGTGNSQIVANKGRVTVQAHGLTNIQAVETAYLTEKGVSTSAPQVTVQHRSSPYAAGVAARSRLVRRLGSSIVMRVVQRNQAQSDAQTAQSTQQKIDAEVRRQSAEIAREANGILKQYGIFALLGPQPAKTLKIDTTAERIQWLGHYASTAQFAAETPAPAVATPKPAVLMQLHESAINNSENWLADRKITDSDFRELVFQTVGLMPAGQDGQTAQIPATITFADEQPLEVRIDQGRLDVTLKLKAFSCQGLQFDRQVWTVRTAYRPKLSSGKLELVRVEPINVQGSSAENLDQLQAILGRFLVEKAASSPSAGKTLASLPPLAIGQLTLEQGWITVALVPEARTAAAKKSVTRRS